MLFPVIDTHGLPLIENSLKLHNCTRCEISFKSVILLLANVNTSKFPGKYNSQ